MGCDPPSYPGIACSSLKPPCIDLRTVALASSYIRCRSTETKQTRRPDLVPGGNECLYRMDGVECLENARHSIEKASRLRRQTK